MIITDARVYIVPPEVSVTSWVNGDPWVLVELRTDCGISGWGHAYTLYDRENFIAQNILDLAQGLDGTDPFDIKRFMISAAERFAASRNGIELAAAAAGIEIALWDIAGKALDSPVHRLIGGRCKDRVRLYANCWSNQIRSPVELSSFAAAQVSRGFRAVKIYPFLHNVSLDHGIACVSAVRETVGADVEIFVDMLECMPDEDLGTLFEHLRMQRVSWLEDPVNPGKIEQLRAIRAASRLPIITGEELYTKQDFARLCKSDVVDVLNPEVALLGILGVKEIAVIAEAYGKQIAVHNANTMTIGLAAALQAAAITPNSDWVEFFPTLEVGSNSFSYLPFDLGEDGCVPVPLAPGLGVSVEQSRLCTMEYGYWSNY